MNFLGIDYGEKRIGLAFADELGLAVPLPAATQASEEARIAAIRTVLDARRIDEVVIGYPYNMDGSVGFKAREVDAFIAKLAARIDQPIHRMDERLTTQAAQAGLEAAGRKGKRDRRERASGEVDSRAAMLILQDHLDAHGHAELPPPPDELEAAGGGDSTDFNGD